MSDPASILVVRLSALGDIVHTLPAVATLRDSFPAARIVWAVEPRWAALLRDNPHVDEVLPIDRRWPSWRALRAARFELAIDFQGLLKSALVARVAGPRRILGFEAPLLRERWAGLLYSQGARSAAAHVVDRNLDLAAAAGARRRRIEFPLPACPPEGELPAGDYVLASPMAGWRGKQWPAAYYAKLARLLQERDALPLVINCSPADRDAAQAIVAEARGAAVLNVTSLEGLIGVTRRARAVVGVDSGPLHLAAALARPGVALFGPTDPARNGPYGGAMVTLRCPDAVTTYKRASSIAASMQALEPERVYGELNKKQEARSKEQE